MLIYIVPFILSIFGIYYCDIHKRHSILLKVFLFIYLVIVLGLRYKVGGDTINYMGYYEGYPSLNEWELTFYDSYSFQPLFSFIFSLSKTISKNFAFFQFLHAILFTSILYYFIKISTKYFFTALSLSLLIFYLYFTTEILRESLAILVFTLNYKNLRENNIFKYYIGAALAICFHISAVILLVLPLLRWLKFDYKYAILVVLVCLSGYLWQDFLNFASSISVLSEKVNTYRTDQSGGFLFSVLIILRYSVIPIVTNYFLKTKYNNTKYENVLCVLSLLGICSVFSYIIFTRFTNYFLILLAVAIAELLCKMFLSYNKSTRQSAIVYAIFILLVYGSYYIHLNMYERWIPYSHIINPTEYDRENFF